MRINHNIAALNTHRQLNSATTAQSKSMEKLASGLRINKAGDDAAGLAISEKMRGQIRGLDQASANAQDGISMIATAEGALNETHDIMQRMRELAVQSGNGTTTNDDRKAIQAEVKQLKEEVDRIGNTTEFNTQKLLNGNLSGAGGTSGINSVSGAQVFKQTAGSMSGAVAAAVDGTATDLTQVDALMVDGKKITVDWNKHLSESDKSILNQDFSGGTAMDKSASGKVRDVLEKAINAAIDESGTGVSHITITDSTPGTFKIESGSTGNSSTVTGFIGDGATATAKLADGTTDAASTNSVLDTFFGAAGTEITTGTTVGGTNNILDALTTADKLQFTINGATVEVTSPAAAAGTDANTYADLLTTAVNNAFDTYNSAAGFTNTDKEIKDVTVKVENGRLSITSPSGSVELSDVQNGKALSKLGLDTASRESAGSGAMTFQIGANKGQTISFSVSDMRTNALGISGLDFSTQTGAQEGLSKLDTAIQNVSSERGKLGAVQNRLEHTINNLNTSSENLTAAESRIRDVDYALAA